MPSQKQRPVQKSAPGLNVASTQVSLTHHGNSSFTFSLRYVKSGASINEKDSNYQKDCRNTGNNKEYIV